MLSYQIITNEIPVKGIGYLILNDPEALKQGVDELISKGATTIYAKGALEEGEQDGLQVIFAHDMLMMERELTNLPVGEAKLKLEPLRRQEVPAYVEIYNESFRSVPNGSTIGRAEADKLVRPEQRAGIAWLGTRPVGIYDCTAEGEVPVIEAIGIIKVMRRKGLGGELLRTMMMNLAGEGYTRCKLMVSTANEGAFSLYRAEGFTVSEKVSAWYEVRRHA